MLRPSPASASFSPRQQKYPEAAAAYRQGLALDPKLPASQLNLGLAEFKQGHFSPPLRPFRAALAADPTNTQARTLLGLSYYGASNLPMPSQYLEPAAKGDPANAELHSCWPRAACGRRTITAPWKSSASSCSKTRIPLAAHILLGEALDGLGKTPEAIAEFEAAAKISPTRAQRAFRPRLSSLEVAAV